MTLQFPQARKTIVRLPIHRLTTCLALCTALVLPILSHAQEPSILDDGLAKMDKGYYSAAIDRFVIVLKQYPDNFPANMGMGISLRETDRPDSALWYLDRAIKIQPTAEGYLNRAATYYTLKQTAKGDRDMQAAAHLQTANLTANIYGLRGYCLLMKKDYAKAVPLFDSAIALDKNPYKDYVNKAAALNNLKRVDEAIAVLDRVIALKPDYFKAIFDRAYTYAQSGDLDQAFSDCNRLFTLDDKSPDALIFRAGLKDKTGDDPGAIEDCNQALAIDPNNAKGYNMRALARFDAHAYKEIIADCDRAIALKPDYYDPYIQRGDAYDDLGEYDKAIADYKSAISIDPTQLIAFRECAASVAHKGDLKGSLYYLDKGLEIEPGNTYLLGHKYRILLQNGDIKGAVAALDQCIKFHPDSPMIYQMEKSDIYDSVKDYASACKFAFEALKGGLINGYEYINTHSCPAYKKNPLVLAQPFIIQSGNEFNAGMFTSQIATLTKAIALLPDSPLLYYNRGGAKRKLNDFAGAIEDYNKCLNLKPKFAMGIVARAVAKQYLNDPEGAKKDCLLAIKIDSGYAIAYNNYGSLIEDTDPSGAIDYYSKAIQHNKQYTNAWFHRAKLYLKLGKKAEACTDLKKAEALGSEEAKIERIVNCK
jgi:tetratricopeptide (TPR) repeat protein